MESVKVTGRLLLASSKTRLKTCTWGRWRVGPWRLLGASEARDRRGRRLVGRTTKRRGRGLVGASNASCRRPGCFAEIACQGSEFRIWGLGCRVWGVGCGVWGMGCGVWSFGLRFGVWGLGFGVQGVGLGSEGLGVGFRAELNLRAGHVWVWVWDFRFRV